MMKPKVNVINYDQAVKAFEDKIELTEEAMQDGRGNDGL